MENSTENPQPSPLSIALQEFMAHFAPADSEASSDELMSTSDIADYLADMISEDDIDNTLIFQVLKQNGYTFRFTNGFTWLLKRK